MKITVYTQNCGNFSDMNQQAQRIDQAAQFAKQHGSALLVTPGWSLGCFCYEENGKRKSESAIHYDDQSKAQAKAQLQHIADKNDIAIVAEVVDTYLFKPNQSSLKTFKQRFAKSAHDITKFETFANEWNEGQRYFTLDDQTFGLMLCGENNFIANEQGNANHPKLRYPELGWRDDYEILLNPTHRIMGNWGKLHQRFAFLSQNNRLVIHVANDDSKSGLPSKSAICVYQDGKCIVQGDLANYPENLYMMNKAEGWLMLTVDTEHVL